MPSLDVTIKNYTNKPVYFVAMRKKGKQAGSVDTPEKEKTSSSMQLRLQKRKGKFERLYLSFHPNFVNLTSASQIREGAAFSYQPAAEASGNMTIMVNKDATFTRS